MARQLGLALPHQPQMTRADYLVGASNEAAVALIDRFPDWPNRNLLLIGPAGSGKSHLGRIWREIAGARAVQASELHETEIEPSLAAARLLVEDLQEPGLDEAALFHLFNRARERGAFLMLTSRVPPSELAITLPDLVSRLRAALPVELPLPDDELLRRVLVKLFADRQLRVDPSLIDYLARRIERSYDAANRVVAALDAAALAAGRPITRQLAATVLDLAPDGEEEPSS